MKIKKKYKLKLIPANFRDLKFLLSLRNERVSIKNSKNKKKISLFEHSHWFKKNIINKNIIILIAKKNNKAKDRIGFIKYEKEENFTKVSIAIKKKFRNLGIGTELLKLSENHLKGNHILLAAVRKKNIGSIKLFLANNYQKICNKKNFLKFAKIFIQNKGLKNKIKVIDEIQNIRRKNNINWMDILRVAFKYSPDQTSNLVKKVSSEDKKINLLSKKL